MHDRPTQIAAVAVAVAAARPPPPLSVRPSVRSSVHPPAQRALDFVDELDSTQREAKSYSHQRPSPRFMVISLIINLLE
jgi:hypothetical protein